MDITKSREDFEEKFSMPKHVIRCGTGYAVTDYNSPTANQYMAMWVGWQAALESIEVDIPEEMTCREALEQGYTSDYANGFTAAIIQCYAVVRTAGIRIKGESE